MIRLGRCPLHPLVPRTQNGFENIFPAVGKRRLMRNEHHHATALCLVNMMSTYTNDDRQTRFNKSLESIKEQGQGILEATTSDIQSKTKRHLLIEDEDHGPTIYQLKEASKVKRLVEEAIENYTSRRGNTFCIMNEPIAIVDVEITEDLRQARVFWCLPYALLLMSDNKTMNSVLREKLGARMQKILDDRGGALQGYVHSRLRSYFRPPKLRFVRAEGEMLRRSIQEYF